MKVPYQPVRVAMTGAYLTGFAVEVDSVSESQLRGWQEAVARLLQDAEGTSEKWIVPRYGTVTPSLRYSGAAYEGLLPSNFLHTAWVPGKASSLEHHLTNYRASPVGQEAISAERDTQWILERYQLAIYPFGVGTLAATYSIAVPDDMEVWRLRDLVADVKPTLAEPYNAYLQEVISRIRLAVARSSPNLVRRPWIQGQLPTSEEDAIVNRRNLSVRRYTRNKTDQSKPDLKWFATASPPELLWVHSVYLLTNDNFQAQLWDDLLPFLHSKHTFAGLAYYPGTESSVAVWASQPSTEYIVAREEGILKVLLLQWAYFAASAEIDRGLWSMLNRLGAGALGTTELETQLETILTVYEKTRILRSRLNTLLAEYGGGFIALWEAGAGVQGLEQLFASVDDKLDAVQMVCQNKLETLAATRERRLNRTVSLFTVFTVASSIVALVTFFTPPATRLDIIRALIVMVLSMITVLIVVFSRREVRHRA